VNPYNRNYSGSCLLAESFGNHDADPSFRRSLVEVASEDAVDRNVDLPASNLLQIVYLPKLCFVAFDDVLVPTVFVVIRSKAVGRSNSILVVL
jgi:hypothetical protein